MNPDAIVAALKAGAAIFKEAEGLFGIKAKAAIDAGATIVNIATGLYDRIKPVLSETDTAKVDAAVDEAHATAGADLARVLSELDAAALR